MSLKWFYFVQFNICKPKVYDIEKKPYDYTFHMLFQLFDLVDLILFVSHALAKYSNPS
jgi:hypothetical protein